MQRFAVVLFALVALFVIIAPSSASTLSHVKRETNADRFARGLPPLPPTRRATAKRQQNSQPAVPSTGRIQVRDHNGNGKSLGYVQNGPSGPHGVNLGTDPDYSDLYVIFNPVEHRISCQYSDFDGNGGSYFGAPATSEVLSVASTVYVLLTNVDIGNEADEADIWSIDPAGQLTAVWENADSSTVPVSFAYNDYTNALALVGDIVGFTNDNPDWDQVDLFIV
jgi:hypothetical protein